MFTRYTATVIVPGWYYHQPAVLSGQAWYAHHSYFSQHVVLMQSRYICCGVNTEPLRQRNVIQAQPILRTNQDMLQSQLVGSFHSTDSHDP